MRGLDFKFKLPSSECHWFDISRCNVPVSDSRTGVKAVGAKNSLIDRSRSALGCSCRHMVEAARASICTYPTRLPHDCSPSHNVIIPRRLTPGTRTYNVALDHLFCVISPSPSICDSVARHSLERSFALQKLLRTCGEREVSLSCFPICCRSYEDRIELA